MVDEKTLVPVRSFKAASIFDMYAIALYPRMPLSVRVRVRVGVGVRVRHVRHRVVPKDARKC